MQWRGGTGDTEPSGKMSLLMVTPPAITHVSPGLLSTSGVPFQLSLPEASYSCPATRGQAQLSVRHQIT